MQKTKSTLHINANLEKKDTVLIQVKGQLVLPAASFTQITYKHL